MIALVTGASSGIGFATALELAKLKYDLIICGRRTEKLKELQLRLNSLRVKSTILVFDITKKEEVENAFNTLPQEWQNIDVLVNSAGGAHGMSTFQDGLISDWEEMIDSNVKGLLYISKLVVKNMIAKNDGHIIHLNSIAGKEVYLNGNVYCASKHAVEALTKGMRIDLMPHGIKVSSVSPGLVETEFSMVRFKGDTDRANKVYEGFTPLKAEDVADAIGYIVSRPKHVCVGDMILFPRAQASSSLVDRTGKF